jgi:hypothetical protein
LTKAKYQGTVTTMPLSATNSPKRSLESLPPEIQAQLKRLWAARGCPPTGPTFQIPSEEERQQFRKASLERLRKSGLVK